MLNLVLRANAVSCALFGALFALSGPASAAFIGTPPVLLLQILGAGLLIYAALLIWISLRAQKVRIIILIFALGDAIWVGATAVLIVAGLWITTPAGVLWAIGVAIFVGICGALQWKLAP